MPVGPLSRHSGLDVLVVTHATRGRTRSLPVRRRAAAPPPPDSGRHRYGSSDSADLLALRYFGREDLYWSLLDANGGRLPGEFQPGEVLVVPPVSQVTRVGRPVL
jgi:hypothetical protein